MTEGFIDRREYARALETFVDQVPTRACALWLEGDAGIGKTTLWHDGIRIARRAGLRVVQARSAMAEATLAFTTLSDLLTPILPEVRPRLHAVQREALEVALLLRIPHGPPPDTRVLGTALLAVVRELAATGPLLLAVDDYQWIDSSSAEVLTFMLRRLDDEPVGLLATVRGSADDLGPGTERLMPRSETLTVGALSVHETQQLLELRFGLHLSRPRLLKLHNAAGGNPFFAVELGRAAVEGAVDLDGGPLSLPPRVSELVTRRLTALPPGTRDALVAVAALGNPTVSTLEQLDEDLIEDLELAQVHDLVLDGDCMRFTHPLLAAACYQCMPLHRRRRLHQRLSRLDLSSEERARHLALAATGPDDEIAAALAAAARQAQARGGVQSACELSELSLRLSPASSPELSLRRVEAADHRWRAGDPTRAGELLEAAVRSTPPGPLRARALGELAGVRATLAGFRAAEDLYQQALGEPGLGSVDRARLTAELAWGTNAGGFTRVGLERAESALALAVGAGDAEVLASCLCTVAELTFWRTGQMRRDLLDRAVRIEDDLGYAVDARGTLARLLARCDRYAEARPLFVGLVEDARARDVSEVTGHLFFLIRMELAAGDWSRAQSLSEEALEAGRLHGEESVEALCRMTLAELAAYRGQAERARREIPELRELAERMGFVGAVHRLSRALGSLELACHDPAAAWEQVGSLFEGSSELSEVLAQLAGSVGIEALVGLDEQSAARHLLARLEEAAETADSGLRLLAGRCRGVLLDATGDSEQAIAVLCETADDTSEQNALELHRTVLALGTAQRRAQRKRDARLTLERAVVGLDRLGASGWADRARSELRRIGGRVSSDETLSETERLIAQAVVAGRRNGQVAEDLHLSPHTVAWNLTKIYRKLGVGSRTELAAVMAAAPEGKTPGSSG
jgi:DNA-binding NarL/FixJ family response regulator